jgi:glycosyltransferase involved in cell wall biosynthesis
MKTLSVIVPVYNTEDYLTRCIDSIINQTYTKLEIILVNDGSSDTSGSMCHDFAKKDDRIIVIDKENGGQSSARNVGISKVTGEYITFVDSDDWIVNDIYEYCISLVEENNCDAIDFEVEYSYGDKVNEVNPNSSYTIIEGKAILRDYLFCGQKNKAPFSPCRKIYRRSIFNEVLFPEGKINEDIATNYRALIKANSLIKTDKIGYYYYQDSSSTTRNGLRFKDFDLIDACNDLIMLTENEEYQDIKYLAQVKLARSYFSLLAKVAFYGIEDKELDRKEIICSLTKKLRRNYWFLLGSPMPLNRKLMVTMLCINIKLLSIPLKLYKRITRK